jgi:hypothetical protein
VNGTIKIFNNAMTYSSDIISNLLLQPNPHIAPSSLSDHTSLPTEIPYYTVLQFIATLDIPPQTAVMKQWRYIRV